MKFLRSTKAVQSCVYLSAVGASRTDVGDRSGKGFSFNHKEWFGVWTPCKSVVSLVSIKKLVYYCREVKDN